jgi:hypothetical protein
MPFSDANEPTERPNPGHGISRNAILAAADPLVASKYPHFYYLERCCFLFIGFPYYIS